MTPAPLVRTSLDSVEAGTLPQIGSRKRKVGFNIKNHLKINQIEDCNILPIKEKLHLWVIAVKIVRISLLSLSKKIFSANIGLQAIITKEFFMQLLPKSR